uniref:Uncharacterized protein n=1 Tax=Vespula pensylvanica TaxID=30213 RepID=A0A834P898_VESPE|nr:hypothetical protein H0235_004841 [Vespula pensylvanica]
METIPRAVHPIGITQRQLSYVYEASNIILSSKSSTAVGAFYDSEGFIIAFFTSHWHHPGRRLQSMSVGMVGHLAQSFSETHRNATNYEERRA